MRKKQKKELEVTLRGLHLWPCPDHKLPLVRHEVKDAFGKVIGYCWDCPGKMTREQQEHFRKGHPDMEFNDDTPCFYHVHEGEY